MVKEFVESTKDMADEDIDFDLAIIAEVDEELSKAKGTVKELENLAKKETLTPELNNKIRQYTKDGDVAIDFDFIDCWPSAVDPIELSYDTTGAMEEFNVTWEYNYYTSTAQGTSTDLGNQE